MNKQGAKQALIWFVLYSCIGWCYEVFLEVVVYKWGFSDRGVLFGPYCPVYGFGALIFIAVLYGRIKGKPWRDKLLRLPLIFAGCMVLATAVELAASYLCELVMGSWPWQTYSGYALNFQGRIALSPSIRFGLGGAVFLYLLQPLFEKLTGAMREQTLNGVSLALAVLLGADGILTALF